MGKILLREKLRFYQHSISESFFCSTVNKLYETFIVYESIQRTDFKAVLQFIRCINRSFKILGAEIFILEKVPQEHLLSLKIE